MLTIRRNTAAIEAFEASLLAQAKAEAHRSLNEWVAAERAKFITVLPGQEMIYIAKEAEAYRYLADPNPDLANYTFIADEVGVTAPEPYQIAQIWAYMATLWRGAAGKIEKSRLNISAQIDAATTKEEVAAAWLLSPSE